jgi:hypothetical protein
MLCATHNDSFVSRELCSSTHQQENDDMTDSAIARKAMTIGEGGTALALVALRAVSETTSSVPP